MKLEGPWDVNACPTIVFADARGRRFAQTMGATEVATEEYLKQLDKIRKIRVTRDESLLKSVQSKGLERARLLDQALRAMPDRVLTSYTDEIREILKLDPTDQLKSRSRYLAQEAKVRLDEANPLAEKQDWDGVLRVLNDEFDEPRPGRERRPERIPASCPCSRLSWPFRAGRPRLRTVPHRCAGASVLLV